MTTGTAFLLDRYMFEYKGSGSFRVAVRAHSKLARRGAQLASNKTPVRVVAVAALDQSGIDAMAVGPVELGFLRGVTSVAKQGLLAL